MKLSAFLLIFLFFSTATRAETLLELYRLAKQNDPELKIAEREWFAIQTQRPQAQAALKPQVVLGGDVSENWQLEDWMSGDDIERTTVGYNISLSYALYRKENEIAVKQADAAISQAAGNYEAAKQQLIARLAEKYFAVLAAKDNVKFARSTKDAFQRQLDQAQKRFEVGLIAITDVQESRAGYDLAVAEEIQAVNQVDNAYEGLREITGDYHQIDMTLSGKLPLEPPDPENMEQWTKTALENNPQIIVAQHGIESARQNIEKQRAANEPTVDLVGRHGYTDVLRGNDDPFGTSSGTSNSIGVQLSYLLYEGGGIQARIGEAQQRYNQALDQLEKVKRTVQLQTHNAYLNVLSNISRVKASKQALESTKTALEAIQTGYEVGTRTSVDVLNARRDLLQAQRDYSNARYDYVLNTLNLKYAAGLISEEDLAAINQWLLTPEAAAEQEALTAAEEADMAARRIMEEAANRPVNPPPANEEINDNEPDMDIEEFEDLDQNQNVDIELDDDFLRELERDLDLEDLDTSIDELLGE